MAGRKRKYRGHLPAYRGDHGPNTELAHAGTVIELLKDERTGKKNPNNMARRRRIEVIDHLSFLSLRQYQAAREIRDAFCALERLTSGTPLKEQVDTSARPDAFMAAQVDAMTRWRRAMDAVPRQHRRLVEMICCQNVPITQVPWSYATARSDMQGAMTCVANRLRF